MTAPAFGPQDTERLQELTSQNIEHLRERAQTDLFFLSKGVLSYNQLEQGAHGALCQFMTVESSNRRMVLMPRGFLKTTICTISDSIRLTLCDPNIRILIQNEVLENAVLMLAEIRQHWEKTPLLRFLFPELVPPAFRGQGVDWSQDHASVVRTKVDRVSTYTASGSGGSPQSRHFEVIKNDDLIGEKARTSQAEMGRAIAWADAQLPLLDRLDGQLDYYGTRKSMGDVYAHIMEKYKSRIKVFVREPIEQDVSIFSKFPTHELLAIMVDTPDMWAYDYMNNPVGKGGLDWGRGLLRQYSLGADRVFFEDHITGKPASWSLRELDIVVCVDPNSGKASAPDKAAVVVAGISPKDQIFVLSAKSKRWTPDELIETVWDDAYKWKPRVIAFEEAGQQNTLYYFEKKMQIEQFYFRVQGLKHSSLKNKEERIRAALDTPMKARRVYVQAGQLELIGQIQLFPSLADHNWDEIDCLSFGPEVFQGAVSLEDQEADRAAEVRVLSIDRGRSGYGRSV